MWAGASAHGPKSEPHCKDRTPKNPGLDNILGFFTNVNDGARK